MGNPANLEVQSAYFESQLDDEQTAMINAMEDQLHHGYLQTGGKS